MRRVGEWSDDQQVSMRGSVCGVFKAKNVPTQSGAGVTGKKTTNPSLDTRARTHVKKKRAPLKRDPVSGLIARAITVELATRFRQEFESDRAHNIESAAFAAGINPSTVRDAMKRHRDNTANEGEDALVCQILADAHSAHIRRLRGEGFGHADGENAAGVSWLKWQLEVQDPLNHPRGAKLELEHAGKDGGPMQVQAVSTAEAAKQLAELAATDPEVAEVLRKAGERE